MAGDHSGDPSQLLIVVRGGVVSEVFSSEDVQVLILDLDTYPDETLQSALSKLAGELSPQAICELRSCRHN
jgi:hypothetical protein